VHPHVVTVFSFPADGKITSRRRGDTALVPTAEDVDRWKIEQLDRLGFGLVDINMLLLWRVELHDVYRLMGTGAHSRTSCTHDQALRILRPLDVDAPARVEEEVAVPA